jgi:hypothetical protein
VGGASGSGGAAGKAGSSGMGGTAGGAPDGSAGTGGTAGGMPEAGRDGTTDADASTGDSGLNTCNTAGPALGLTCDDYCSTFITVCKPIPLWMNTYADKAACMSACASLNQAALCCRAQHVNLARDADGGADISMHCGHSTGMSPCT